ncbi:MAG: LAGLIDADG family homing endonuclease [Candidatus Nealsonbacteria bacterium]
MKKQIIKIPQHQLRNFYLKQNLSIIEIAKKLRLCRDTIRRELKRHKIILRTKAEALGLSGKKRRIPKSTIEQLYFKNSLTQKQIGGKLGRHHGTILRLMKEYGLKARERSETSTRYPKFDFSNNLEEKAYLIGFRVGDLNVKLSPNKNLIIAGTTSTKREQIKLFEDLFKKYGHVWISKKRNDGNRFFIVRLNHTFEFLLPKQDNIPKWIKENDNYFLSFLAGYTDAEGCIFINKNNVSRFQLASYDKNILRQIYKKLDKINIKCHPPRILVKKRHIKSDGLVYRNDYWCFTISKKSSLLSLLRFLKPRLKHLKRLNDLMKAEKNIIGRNQKVR